MASQSSKFGCVGVAERLVVVLAVVVAIAAVVAAAVEVGGSLDKRM